MWPGGQPMLAEPVPVSHGAPGPAGCLCHNQEEQDILDFGLPPGQYGVLVDEIEIATRQACDSLVPAGWNHNCFITVGPGASNVGGLAKTFVDGHGECISDCSYINPPPGGACPDPNPYECNGGGGDGVDGEDSGESGAEGDVGGNLGSGAYIDCSGTECDVDLGFAELLFQDMSLLASEGATIVYDTNASRFVFYGIVVGSLSSELGLDNGDQIESVNGLTIDDLDSALQAISESDTETEFRIRVKRGTQWIDFTYTLVP